MIKVSNRKCIRHLSWKSLKAARTRNLIAIMAIALTTVLFTSLFTIALSLNDGIQQNSFRQVGGFSHGGFKYLTEEQFYELREDPLIQEWGLRRFVGMPRDVPFNKSHVEIGYSDANQAHWMFCDPVEGRLPQEGTNEAATDLRILELLGVEPELGTEFTISFYVDGKEATQTFNLCGWWEYDEAIVANHVLIPESRVNAILAETGVDPAHSADGMTGSWNLDVMLGSSLHIERDIKQILTNCGYQADGRSYGDNYIPIGVNWAYTGVQLADSMDPMLVLSIAAVLLLIIFTGYLIIYNVFQISVTNDIRFYGLLKTIGTTPTQLKRIIRQQALILCVVGIPIGLILGWVVGAQLTPVVISQLNGVHDMVSVSPVIFVGAALFSLLTVLISCARPGRIAAKVSPIEAVRYTEVQTGKRTIKKNGKGVSLLSMAKANLGRSRSKTLVTILSLSLAVVLLTLTVTFTNGFDMGKYLSRFVCTDFILSDAAYFQVGNYFSSDTALPQEAIEQVRAMGGIAEGGKIYGRTSVVQQFITEEWLRVSYGRWSSPEELDALVALIALEEKDEKGFIPDDAQLYGMEPFALGKLNVLDGDISKLQEPGSRYIAAVYSVDDYGDPDWDSAWAKVGDIVKLRYVEEFEYYNPYTTGAVYEDPNSIGDREVYRTRAVKYRDAEYEVAALVAVPHAISYRHYGQDEYVLNDQTFIQDSGTNSVLLYAFDTTEEANPVMESFLADYTKNVNPSYDYESKATYQAEFESMRSMFLMLGGVLSFIVGLVGVLNFCNAILTGIIARRREFAVLQSIGMTGKQLKAMLVYEGLFYAVGSLALALGIILVFSPMLKTALESMFWFFTFRFTVTPVLILTPIFVLLGCLVPLTVYRSVAKSTIVERLREADT